MSLISEKLRLFCKIVREKLVNPENIANFAIRIKNLNINNYVLDT